MFSFLGKITDEVIYLGFSSVIFMSILKANQTKRNNLLFLHFLITFFILYKHLFKVILTPMNLLTFCLPSDTSTVLQRLNTSNTAPRYYMQLQGTDLEFFFAQILYWTPVWTVTSIFVLFFLQQLYTSILFCKLPPFIQAGFTDVGETSPCPFSKGRFQLYLPLTLLSPALILPDSTTIKNNTKAVELCTLILLKEV